MSRTYGFDFIGGRKIPQLVIAADHDLSGVHSGTVHVEAGRFRLLGTIKGTLDIQDGVSAEIVGTQEGTVSVASGATVAVLGAIEGTLAVARGATVTIEASGKLGGTLSNHGTVIVRGVFGGAQTGDGELRLEGKGYIKEPRIENGMHIYTWSRDER